MGLFACTLASLLLAGNPLPQRARQTTIQDDTVLLHGTDTSVKSAMGQIASLGFSYVRITAGWSAISPSPTSAKIPGAPFAPTNPATYPWGGFHELDRAVLDAHAAGIPTRQR